MRTRDRPERGDQRDQGSAGGERVREQREPDAAAGEALAHDPRADDRREQEARAHRLGGGTARERHRAALPAGRRGRAAGRRAGGASASRSSAMRSGRSR